MSSRLLVTGAGLLGSAVAARARADGWEVATLDVTPGDVEGEGTRHLRQDLTDAAGLDAAVTAWVPHAIVHTAAIVGDQAERDPANAREVNVRGTLNVIAVAARSGAALVHVSSLAVYGDGVDDGPTENAPLRPRSVYGKTKKIAEGLVLEAERAGILRHAVVVRPAGLYGPVSRRTGGRRMTALHDLVAGVLAGTPVTVPAYLSAAAEYLWVDDAAEACVRLLAAETHARVFNVGAGDLVDGSRLADALRAHGPRARVDVAETESTGARLPLDVRRARDEFGYRPRVRFEEGLRALADSLAAGRRRPPAVAARGPRKATR